MTQRVLYFDQMKGLAIVFVVANHLLQFSFGVQYSSASYFMELFDLPAFFLIAGYFCYKDYVFNHFFLCLWNKFKRLIIPMLTIGTLAQVIGGYPFFNALIANGGGRYWFLEALFLMNLVAIFCVCLSKCLRIRRIWFDAMLFFVPYGVFVALKYFHVELPGWARVDSFVTYYCYFIVGLLMRKYESFDSIVKNSQLLFTASIIMVLVGFYFKDTYNPFINLAATCGIIVLLYQGFAHANGDAPILRCLAYVGRHTLPIFLLHYFFVFDLTAMTPYITGDKQIVLQMLCSLTGATILVLICILIDLLVRRSRLGRFLLHGKI